MTALILIDLSGIFWANWHATVNEPVSAAFERTVGRVHTLAQDFDLCAVCCDTPPYKRSELLPEYKAQREKAGPQAAEEFAKTKERLAADGFLLWSDAGQEADDVIATAVKFAKGRELHTTIVSSDKDLLQLVDDHANVAVMSLRNSMVYDSKAVAEKFGVPPPLMCDLLALTGDSSDNIKGAPGVGAVKAAKLIHDFGSAGEAFAAALNEESPITPALRKTLLDPEVQSNVNLAMRLVRLNDNCRIDFEELFQERKAVPLAQEADLAEEYGMNDEQEEQERPADEETKSDPRQEPPAPEEGHGEPPPRENEEQRVRAIVRAHPSFELSLNPSAPKQVFSLAAALHNSRMYGKKFNSPEQIATVIFRGRELGLGALTSLDLIHFVQGNLALHAHYIADRAKRHPDCEYLMFVGGDDTFAEYETKNRNDPKPTRLKYTIEQARKANLIQARGNWEARPAEMLRKTCATQLARIVYPSAAMGLLSVEELEQD